MCKLRAMAFVAMLGSAIAAPAQQDLLDRLIGKDLSKLPSSLADMSDLAQLIGEVPKGEWGKPVPWRVWKTQGNGSVRYVVLLVESEFSVPGGSTARIVLLDGSGSKLSAWSFQTGWRGTPSNAALEHSDHVGGDVILIEMIRFINGRNIAKEYFAISHDQLRLIRLEDDKGQGVQNEYIYPNYEIGVVPDVADVDGWIGLLESSERADALAALMFLGGRHLKEPERRFLPDPMGSKYAGLFQQLLGDARIQGLIGKFTRSNDDWIREAAMLAAHPPLGRRLQ
jgi:hypothetical protein